MKPGVVIDAVGHLHEDGQVLRPKVEGVRGTAEIEALVLAERALGIFPDMALGFLSRCVRLHDLRSVASASSPEERLSLVRRRPRQFGRGNRQRPSEARDGFRGLVANSEDVIDSAQRFDRQLRWIDGYENDRGERFQGRRCAHIALRGQEMMGLVHQNPVRAANFGAQVGDRKNEIREKRRPVLEWHGKHIDDEAVVRSLQQFDKLCRLGRRLRIAKHNGGAKLGMVALRIENANLIAAFDDPLQAAPWRPSICRRPKSRR